MESKQAMGVSWRNMEVGWLRWVVAKPSTSLHAACPSLPRVDIAYLSTFHPFRGGIAQFNARLLRELRAKGHTVRPRTFSTQYPSFLFPGTSQLVTAQDAAEAVDAPRTLSSISPFSWRRTATAIIGDKPDILLTRFWMSFFGPSLGYVARTVRARGIPAIALIDNIVPHEGRIIDKPFTRYFLNSCDGFIALSESVRADLIALRPDARAIVLPHPLYDHFGAAMPQNEAQRALGIAAGQRVLLFFGFIRDYKGLDLLIEAMAALPKDHVLVIAGEPYGDMAKYHYAIERLGLRDRVIDRIRYIPDQEVPLYFSAADAVVLPYRSATQSGITAIAQHFQKPVIATDVGGLKEFVDDGRTGVIVPEVSAAAIAAGIDRFGTIAPEVFRENIARVREELSWSGFGERLVAFASEMRSR